MLSRAFRSLTLTTSHASHLAPKWRAISPLTGVRFNSTTLDVLNLEGSDLEFNPTKYPRSFPRTAQQIQALVQNVILVRSQQNGAEEIYDVMKDNTPPIKEEPQPVQADQKQGDQTTNDQLLQDLTSITSEQQTQQEPQLFVDLVLEEVPKPENLPKMETRYSIIQQLKKKAATSPQGREIIRLLGRNEWQGHEIVTMASIDPTRMVLEHAFHYCKRNKLFKPACSIVALSFASKDVSKEDKRNYFLILMRDFPVVTDSAHVLATFQAAKKEGVQIDATIYCAVLQRLAQTVDCNPQILKEISTEAEQAGKILNIHTYNHLIRVFASAQMLDQCERTASAPLKYHSKARAIGLTQCLLVQAACIAKDVDAAWKHYDTLKKMEKDPLVRFKNLYKHLLYVLLSSDAEQHLGHVTILFNDLSNVKLKEEEIQDILQRRPGYPFFCFAMLNYAHAHHLTLHPLFVNILQKEMQKVDHVQLIRRYLDIQNNPLPSILNSIGLTLQYVNAQNEYTALETLLSSLAPFPQTPSKKIVQSKDPYVYAIVIDYYCKLKSHQYVMYTFERMLYEGVQPNFLVHALLFRYYHQSGLKMERNHHLVEMLYNHSAQIQGPDLSWLATALYEALVEIATSPFTVVPGPDGQPVQHPTTITPEQALQTLPAIIPHIVPYYHSNTSLFNAAVQQLAQLRPHLALEMLRAMSVYDNTKVTPADFQLVLDMACNEQGASAKNSKNTQVTDVLKDMKAVGIRPSEAQVTQVVRWLLTTRNLAQAMQVLRDAPNEQRSTDFLVRCAELNEGIWVMQIMTQFGKQLSKAQCVEASSALLAHGMVAVAMDMLRWLSNNAQSVFHEVRAELLARTKETAVPVWVTALQKLK